MKKEMKKHLLSIILITLFSNLNAVAQEAYVVFTRTNGTLTFYYDEEKSYRWGSIYELNSGEGTPIWANKTTGIAGDITTVVFDKSFAEARPTTTYGWFAGLYKLTSIIGLQYLDTSEVTNMQQMFSYCESLTTLDLSNFNTSLVTRMGNMFTNCYCLTSIDLSSFNVSQVESMFQMFMNCKSLEAIDLGNFNTKNVINMFSMFSYCTNLRTIYVGKGWTTEKSIKGSSDMFLQCYKLVGSNGTTYNETHTDGTYAHIDYGTNNPGYLSPHIDKYDLWINNKQVDELNQDDIFGDGKVSYNNGILTLDNVGIVNSDLEGNGISSEIENLIIIVKGTCSVEVSQGSGLILKGNTTIQGDTLIVKGTKNGISNSYGTLTLRGGIQLTSDGGNGIGVSRGDNLSIGEKNLYSNLIIRDSSTVVTLKGQEACITKLDDILIGNPLDVMEPIGSIYTSNSIIDANGNAVKGKVVIKTRNKADVNSDTVIDSADIVAVIKAM